MGDAFDGRGSLMDDPTRRQFIRSFGVACLAVAGGRLVPGCSRAGDAVAAPRPPGATNDGGTVRAVEPSGCSSAGAAAASADSPDAELSEEVREQRARVREMWLALVPEPDSFERWLWADSDGDPCPAREAAHREVLDALVAAGDLRAPVADLVQLAFVEVSYHAWRLRNVGISCYVPDPTEGALRESRERLRRRIAVLDELVGTGAVSAEATGSARSALAYELAIYDAVDDFEKHEGVLPWDSEAELDDWLESGRVTADADELETASWLVEVLLAPGRDYE